ncbi:MAG: zinc ribbon domain-containing protein [Candidatus Bathyarchaeota archaeon]|nr:zinc ribbon domain-containing protein [Candidatus Bathyarchaeota archaeon]
MVNCDRCGFPLPVGAEYCPSCGAPVKRKPEAYVPSAASLGKMLQIGMLGAVLSTMISSFSPLNVDLYFIPSFVSSLIAVYLMRTRELNESVAVALAVYIFADGILAVYFLGTLYSQRIPLAEVYGNYIPTLQDVIMYAGSPVSAVVAGYIGNKIAPKAPVKKPQPFAYPRREEPGGVIYSLERFLEKPSVSQPHKV